jgi:hypothetical protein
MCLCEFLVGCMMSDCADKEAAAKCVLVWHCVSATPSSCRLNERVLLIHHAGFLCLSQCTERKLARQGCIRRDANI